MIARLGVCIIIITVLFQVLANLQRKSFGCKKAYQTLIFGEFSSTKEYKIIKDVTKAHQSLCHRRFGDGLGIKM